jgi:hypothetical protein
MISAKQTSQDYIYTEWEELPENHRFMFEYTDTNGMIYIIIDHNLGDFVHRINDILGNKGWAYLFSNSYGTTGLHIDHQNNTSVRLASDEIPNLEPWTLITPFSWLKNKILNLFK